MNIHVDLLKDIIQSRQQVQVYQTNRTIKLVSAYYVLKSLTTSGVIKDYHLNSDKLCAYLNCTLPTLYKTIKGCEKNGYLKRVGRNLVLNSYSGFSETFDFVFTKMVKVKYNYQTTKFHHCLESVYLQVREIERANVFESKFKALPELIEDLHRVISPDNKGNYRKSLQEIQLQAFKYGHEKFSGIFALNPFTTVNRRTLRKMFNFKSDRSVAYLKTKLQKCNLVRVKPQRILSQNQQRVKHLYIDWDAKTKQTIWVQPDAWKYAPILVS